MLAHTLLLSFALYAIGLTVQAAEVEGVRVDDRIYIAQGVPELVLNGAGVRRKLVVAKVYVAALYLTKKQTVSDAVLADPGAKRVAMHILQEEISADQLIGAAPQPKTRQWSPAMRRQHDQVNLHCASNLAQRLDDGTFEYLDVNTGFRDRSNSRRD